MGAVKYAYVRNHKGVPVGVVAFNVTNETVKYGTATHCPTDRFDRVEGRRISNLRLERKPFEVKLPEDGTAFTALVTVLLSIRHNEALPKRLRWNARKTLRSMRRKILASALKPVEGGESLPPEIVSFDSLTRRATAPSVTQASVAAVP